MRDREGDAGSAPGHQEVLALLPWYQNGTLEPSEREAVALHVERCAECRDELALWQDTETAARWTQDGAWEPPLDQLDRLLGQLPGQAAADRTTGPFGRLLERWRRSWSDLPDRARWVVAVQSAVVAGLAAVVLWQGTAPEPRVFVTLSDAGSAVAAEGPRVAVAFADDTTLAQLREILASTGGRIVDGPSALGIYTLRLAPEARVEQVVRSLREDPRTRLVEPLGAVER